MQVFKLGTCAGGQFLRGGSSNSNSSPSAEPKAVTYTSFVEYVPAVLAVEESIGRVDAVLL